MFKIKNPGITDLTNLEKLFSDDKYISLLCKNKALTIIQCLLPYNLKFLPSIHIAIDENNILGYVILKCASRPNNSWQIENLFVTSEVRSKGIGEELLRYVLSIYGSYGIEHFLAEVDCQNLPALSLFHQCGFRRYAKVCFYEKETELEVYKDKAVLDKEFLIRQQTNNDLSELEKLDLSSIPPDLRPALGRSKDYFKQKSNSVVLVQKSRNLIIGWAQVQKAKDCNFIELLISPGWTHLYEQFLNTIIYESLSTKEKIKTTVKVIDYLTELMEILNNSGFTQTNIKELLVRTIWQKVKERKTKTAKVSVARTVPT